uniref:DH domain-containing protein n=1 Tax=Mesocestoides corti TaxID=53468 RepID=A0A5K3F8N1_MESCO
MRKRNSIVFKLFEGEEEYVQQLITLVTCFLRPFRMAASSKKPIITHEDVNSICLNVETLMFLHQIFVQGLRRKMENWPTLKLGDLFDMLLPMLGVYQEYVRNHHYSLQVLAEYKMKEEFNRTLKRCEEKSQCEGRSIESFLTCPMYQIPRYLVTLHEILAHTPREHVDRRNLEFAKSKLETLSQVIHDEVSETENIRKNLSIERMISDGCDILLDANQVFVRQGTLVQVKVGKASYSCPRISQLGSTSCEKKETLRQVFLFTNHLLIATRTNSGRLKLAKKYGKIPLQGCNLIEDLSSDVGQDEGSHVTLPPGTPEELSPTSLTHSVQEDTASTAKAPQADTVEVQQTSSPTSPSTSLMPAKLAHGSLMLAALALGPTGTDTGGKSKLEQCTGSFARKNIADESGDDLGSPEHHSLSRTTTSSLGNGPFSTYKNLVFQITWPGDENGRCSIWLVASNLQEKEAWCSDISQCIEQLHYSETLSIAHSEVSSISMPYSIRLDPGLFKDCPDIKYRSTKNSCKMPQVRYGTLGRLLSHLLDPRFQSIDYLNTFLLTYRVFTTGFTLIAVLRCVLRDPLIQLSSTKIDPDLLESTLQARPGWRRASKLHADLSMHSSFKGPRRVSTGMLDGSKHQIFFMPRNLEENLPEEEERETGEVDAEVPETSRGRSASVGNKATVFRFSEGGNVSKSTTETIFFNSPSTSTPTIQEEKDELHFSRAALIPIGEEERDNENPPVDSIRVAKSKPAPLHLSPLREMGAGNTDSADGTGIHSAGSDLYYQKSIEVTPPPAIFVNKDNGDDGQTSDATSTCTTGNILTPTYTPSIVERRSLATSVPSVLENDPDDFKLSVERCKSGLTRQRSHVSYTYDGSSFRRAPRAGAIITSARLSRRRSSNWAAVKAFAIATAASNSSRLRPPFPSKLPSPGAASGVPLGTPKPSYSTAPSSPLKHTATAVASGAIATTRAVPECEPQCSRLPSASSITSDGGRETLLAGLTVVRVLNVARHWITKYPEDFDGDPTLKSKMQILLEELLRNPRLNVSNRKVAFQLSREILNDQLVESRVDLALLMTPTQTPSKENFDTIPALDIAEELTYIDYHIFRSIRTEELLNQVWMKDGKETNAPNVMLATKRFNEVSKLVVSEVISRSEVPERAACIEKWIAIADICRCLQNYNGVLQICAGLENSSVHRLRGTWEAVSKQSRQSLEKLLTLVAATARFKNMREALHRCDPPCIPYLGMYLTDLSFIGEGSLDVTEHGLINFCKMRMLAHVLMKIRRYTQSPYMIEIRQEVVDYLLDPTRLLTDDQTYEASLNIEPRRSFNQEPTAGGDLASRISETC